MALVRPHVLVDLPETVDTKVVAVALAARAVSTADLTAQVATDLKGTAEVTGALISMAVLANATLPPQNLGCIAVSPQPSAIAEPNSPNRVRLNPQHGGPRRAIVKRKRPLRGSNDSLKRLEM